MRLSRNALDVACAGSGAARSRVALWALVGALGFMALLFMVSSGWRSIGWRAGLFCALAALVPEPRRPGASSLVDVAVAALACVIELVTRSSLATICIGAAASATGWSLGRSALALIKLYGAGPVARPGLRQPGPGVLGCSRPDGGCGLRLIRN